MEHSDGRLLARIEEELLAGVTGAVVEGRSAVSQVISWNAALFNIAAAANGEHGDGAALFLSDKSVGCVVQAGYGIGPHLEMEGGAIGLENNQT